MNDTVMQSYTLTIIFNEDKSKLLMCYNQKLEKFNFVGGKREATESFERASYRELFEETGITEDDVKLEFVREEIVFLKDCDWHMWVTVGVLNKEVALKEEKNPLLWVSVDDVDKLLSSDVMGDGNCYTFYREACKVLGIVPLEVTEELGYKKVTFLNTDSIFEFSMSHVVDNMVIMDKNNHSNMHKHNCKDIR